MAPVQESFRAAPRHLLEWSTRLDWFHSCAGTGCRQRLDSRIHQPRRKPWPFRENRIEKSAHQYHFRHLLNILLRDQSSSKPWLRKTVGKANTAGSIGTGSIRIWLKMMVLMRSLVRLGLFLDFKTELEAIYVRFSTHDVVGGGALGRAGEYRTSKGRVGIAAGA